MKVMDENAASCLKNIKIIRTITSLTLLISLENIQLQCYILSKVVRYKQ